MKGLKVFALATVAALCMAMSAPRAEAQVSLQVNIGAQPVCPYGYFDYAPYRCAPFGYYGPQWYSGGIFIGAGPWFHGPEGFHGYINRRYDPRYGYRGAFPARGDHADWGQHRGWEHNFHGTERRQEQRHGTANRGNANDQRHNDKKKNDHPRHD
ncbi:MAG: hypothetical protein WBD67_11040 [Terracidiphilus sp.]